MLVWLFHWALAEEPLPSLTSPTAAEFREQAIDAMRSCHPRTEACSTQVRRDCEAGQPESCFALGLWLSRDPTRHEEACRLLAAACEERGIGCTLAAEMVPITLETVGDRTERQRRLLDRGCDAKDVNACLALADSWEQEFDADVVPVIDALERGCALTDELCVPLAVALVRGPPEGVQRGMALLQAEALRGNRAALDALVAIRWGAKENLPVKLAAALEIDCTTERRRTHPRRCPSLVAQLAPGGR